MTRNYRSFVFVLYRGGFSVNILCNYINLLPADRTCGLNKTFLFLSSSRPFSFKKKSSSVTTRVEIPTKVNNVFKSRDVNVCKNNLVTKSPLTFSTKLERSQKSKINTFSVNSKAKSDCIDNCPPSGHIPSAGSAKVAPTKSDVHFGNGTRASSSLDASLGFPDNNWDDFDDFEIPVSGKNVSYSSEKCELSSEPVPPPDEEQSPCTGKGNDDVSVTEPDSKLLEKEQSCAELNVLEPSVQVAADSPDQDREDGLFGDSPVRPSRRRRAVHTRCVLSNSEEDAAEEPPKEAKGSKLFGIVHNLAIKNSMLMFAWYVFFRDKKLMDGVKDNRAR